MPPGDQVIIVVYQGTGYRFPISLRDDEEVSLGLVQVVATQTL